MLHPLHARPDSLRTPPLPALLALPQLSLALALPPTPAPSTHPTPTPPPPLSLLPVDTLPTPPLHSPLDFIKLFAPKQLANPGPMSPVSPQPRPPAPLYPVPGASYGSSVRSTADAPPLDSPTWQPAFRPAELPRAHVYNAPMTWQSSSPAPVTPSHHPSLGYRLPPGFPLGSPHLHAQPPVAYTPPAVSHPPHVPSPTPATPPVSAPPTFGQPQYYNQVYPTYYPQYSPYPYPAGTIHPGQLGSSSYHTEGPVSAERDTRAGSYPLTPRMSTPRGQPELDGEGVDDEEYGPHVHGEMHGEAMGSPLHALPSPRPQLEPGPGGMYYTSDAETKITEGIRRRCYNCHMTPVTQARVTWRKSNRHAGKILCNKCGIYERTHKMDRPTAPSEGPRRRLNTAPIGRTHAVNGFSVMAPRSHLPQTYADRFSPYAAQRYPQPVAAPAPIRYYQSFPSTPAPEPMPSAPSSATQSTYPVSPLPPAQALAQTSPEPYTVVHGYGTRRAAGTLKPKRYADDDEDNEDDGDDSDDGSEHKPLQEHLVARDPNVDPSLGADVAREDAEFKRE
ncbi:hypothetical protein Q5752_006304 [Cryptotrichosporon argae]